MMIRSAPPSCAHLADRPVPAPAPMTGLPAATCSRSWASASSRVTSHAPDQLVQAVGHRRGERRVVDVGVDLVDLDLAGSMPSRSAAKSASSACGVVERLAVDVDGRDALQRDEEHGGPPRRR